MRLRRTVETSATPERVFAYLADFTTTLEWDPGTVACERVSGDGGVGTTYANTSRFMGRETQLTYVVQTHEPDRLVVLRAEISSMVGVDTIEIAPIGAGSQVTYTADFTFKGALRIGAPLLRPALKKLGDEAQEGLRSALARL